MAITVKVQEDENDIKETDNRVQNYYKPLFIGLGVLSVTILLLFIILTIYQLCHPLPLRRPFTKEDEDDLKIKLYKLQRDYYVDSIDKEEARFNNMHENLNSVFKLVTSRKPECTHFVTRQSTRSDLVDLEKYTKTNLQYMKQTLNGWVANLEYNDMDGSLNKFMDNYKNIFLQDGDRHEEEVDRYFKRFSEFYDNQIQRLEDCAFTAAFKDKVYHQQQELRQKIKIHENEVEKQTRRIESLSEEIIKAVNLLALEKIHCLREFPFSWQGIQKEIVLAKQLLDVLKLKLKKMRLELLSADTFQKVQALVETEREFTGNLHEILNNEIETYFKNAKNIYEATIKQIDTCSSCT